jgi:hypothetical protein
LLHGSRGKPSNRKTAEEIRSRVIKQYRLRYSDFGPAFAAEKLAEEEGVKISVSTLRRILIFEKTFRQHASYKRLILIRSDKRILHTFQNT